MNRLNLFSLTAVFVIFSLLFAPFSSQAAPSSPNVTVYVSGDITDSRTWTAGNLYILNGDLNVAGTGILTIQAGTQVKVEFGFSLNVEGQLILQGTALNPVVFTSNRDNSVGGDTDPTSIPAAPGDWKGITLLFLSGLSSPNFQYARVRYASTGLYFQNQTGGPINKPVTGNLFEFNQTGINLDSATGDITSTVLNNQFKNNTLGMEIQSNSLGNCYPTLQGNLFENNTGFPLLLRGGTFPTNYISNTFSGNGRQAIAVADTIDIGGVWKKVPINTTPGAAILPYVVEDYVEVAQGVSLQIPAGLVIKAGGYALIEVYGQLDLLSAPGAEVVFTSIHDDTYGGDTDGQVVDPASDPWYGLELFYQGGLTTATFDYTRIRYAASGLMVTNGAGSAYSPAINHNSFEFNGFGVNMLVGAAGNIQSAVQNNIFSSNEYGLVAAAPTNLLATGSALPALQSNEFNDHTVYPLALQGSVFPTYSANTFSGNLYPAIAVQGETHLDGAWVSVPGDNGKTLPFVLSGNFEIGKNFSLTIPAGTIVKSGGPLFVVRGSLDLQSAAPNPIVFTSLNDDQYGGDTSLSAPGLTAPRPAPARLAETPGRVMLGEYGFAPLDLSAQPEAMNAAVGDWGGIEIYTNNAIHDIVVRYGAYGLRLINQTSAPINLTITGSVIDFCQTGISFQAANNGGNIAAQITTNQILRCSAGVKVLYEPSYLGVSSPVLHNNNIMLNQIAVENLQTSSIVNAENNWWGDPSGPYHATNLTGRGNPVSNAVDFQPFLTTPPMPPIIQGRAFLPMVQK